MPAPTLSKSRFTSGLQCHRQLWWRCYDGQAPELIPPPARRALFDRGHRVGAVACEHVPGGFQIPFSGRQRKRAVEATREALERGERIIYEAAFEHERVFAAVDILVHGDDGWTLVEVKSSAGVKDQHIGDAALQTWVARASGTPVTRIELMHLNRDCVYPDLSNLFTRADITAKVEAMVPDVGPEVVAQKGTLDLPIPIVAPGPQCHRPYECPFLLRCNPPVPPGDVSEFYRIRADRVADYRDRGIEMVGDLPDDEIKSNGVWLRQREAFVSGGVVVADKLAGAVASLSGAMGYLDFETLGPAIPVWEGCSPFSPIPAQYSLHTRIDGKLTHHEWLAEGGDDPRPALAAELARTLGGLDTIYVYHAPMERGCLQDLAGVVPEHAAALLEARDKVVDLLPIVENHVYHPDFRGSFGLKAVLPALIPELDYSDLRVADGMLASAELEQLLLRPEDIKSWRRRRMREELLQYCGRDTLALVRLHEWLCEPH